MQTSAPLKGNIYLMGFMCCGKSKIGSLLAQHLEWPFLDTDEWIVQETGLTIPEIFSQHGEVHFRNLEKSCILRISKLVGNVVSLGGGSVIDPENWEHISSTGKTIALSYPPEIIASRMSDKKDRPLLAGLRGEALLNRISDLMKTRLPYYQRADLLLHLNKEIEPSHTTQIILGYLKGST